MRAAGLGGGSGTRMADSADTSSEGNALMGRPTDTDNRHKEEAGRQTRGGGGALAGVEDGDLDVAGECDVVLDGVGAPASRGGATIVQKQVHVLCHASSTMP